MKIKGKGTGREHKRKHPYLSMTWEPETVTGILPEPKQEQFRKMQQNFKT